MGSAEAEKSFKNQLKNHPKYKSLILNILNKIFNKFLAKQSHKILAKQSK